LFFEVLLWFLLLLLLLSLELSCLILLMVDISWDVRGEIPSRNGGTRCCCYIPQWSPVEMCIACWELSLRGERRSRLSRRMMKGRARRWNLSDRSLLLDLKSIWLGIRFLKWMHCCCCLLLLLLLKKQIIPCLNDIRIYCNYWRVIIYVFRCEQLSLYKWLCSLLIQTKSISSCCSWRRIHTSSSILGGFTLPGCMDGLKRSKTTLIGIFIIIP